MAGRWGKTTEAESRLITFQPYMGERENRKWGEAIK